MGEWSIGLVEVYEPDGLCHWKMQCEHGQSECRLPDEHTGKHANQMMCEITRKNEP